MTLPGIDPTGQVHHLHWRDLAQLVRDTVGQVDALIVDAPYSPRTHAGHDGQAESVNGTRDAGSGIAGARRSISYPPWTPSDVADFVGEWAPMVSNWFVSITDEDLRGPWREEMERHGLKAFARIPAIESGMTVRFNGDGAPNWTCDVVASRTRRSEHIGAWRPAPYYLVKRERKDVVGGKPLAMMTGIVEDYTRPGDLVCDPCCGAGTTLLAAKLLGRRWIGGDLDETHAELARERLRDLPEHPKKGTLALPWEGK